MAFLTDATRSISPSLLAEVERARARRRGGVRRGRCANHHAGRAVRRLDYSAYGPMAEAECGADRGGGGARWPVAVALRHRIGLAGDRRHRRGGGRGVGATATRPSPPAGT